MDEVFITNNADETIESGRDFACKTEPGSVLVLDGDLGAGKTQFTKGFAEGLGITDEIISPTFNILLQYKGQNVELFHFDLYRLDSEEELDDIGFYETLESGGICLIEWGGKFANCMPDDATFINFEALDENTRRITVKKGN